MKKEKANENKFTNTKNNFQNMIVFEGKTKKMD